LLGFIGPGQLRIFATSNEKYRVRGGNDQIGTRLASLLGSRLVTGAALVALARTSSGRYRVANTPRSTPKATSTAPSNPANAPPARFCRTFVS